MDQQRSVTQLLTSGSAKQFGKEVTNTVQAAHSSTSMAQSTHSLPGAMFGNMTNCTINISPQNLIVNVGQAGVTAN